jgi:hypothetical protein
MLLFKNIPGIKKSINTKNMPIYNFTRYLYVFEFLPPTLRNMSLDAAKEWAG